MLGPIARILAAARKPGPQALQPPAGPVAPAALQTVELGKRDALTITFRRGDTLSRTAEAYAPDRPGEPVAASRAAFLDGLIRLNGGTDRIYAGRSFRLADRANPGLVAAIAVQKSIALRRAAGQALPSFDFNRARIQPGPYDSTLVTLPSPSGSRRFYVLDDARGDRPGRYRVLTQAEWAALAGR